MTLDQASKNELVSKYATAIYTTPNHTEDAHRFRIIFVLERTITEASDFSAAVRSLSLRLSGDGAAVDAARIFYGNTNAKPMIFNRGLPNDLIDQLIQQGIHQKSQHNIAGRSEAITGRSTLRFSQDILVRTHSGESFPLSALNRKTSICCPFHHDTNPSALVIQNKQRKNGIYCFACETSFWPQDPENDFDFQSFDRALEATRNHRSQDAVPGDHSDGLIDADIHDLAEKYLPELTINDGLTLIRSPKGTGKTHFLSQLARSNPSAKILVIGHRRSLIRQMCTRLGLNCYLDDSKGIPGYQERYGISVDSLLKVDENSIYDYILIDESEQVLSHYLSSTLHDKRYKTFIRLSDLATKAKKIVCLDADMGWISYSFFQSLLISENQSAPITIYINEPPKIVDQSIELSTSRNQITGDLLESLKSGKRCYATSNSLKAINSIYAYINSHLPEKRIIKITSEESQSKSSSVQRFFADPTREALEYDLVLSTPTISSGVDISDIEGGVIFDVVYGLFEPLVLNHFDCDQQIARVRNPGRICVYVSPMRSYFETNIDVVREDMRSLVIFDAWAMFEKTGDGDIEGTLAQIFLDLVTRVYSQKRASTIDLYSNYAEYKRGQGYKILVPEPNDELRKIGSKAFKKGSEEYDIIYSDSLLSAEILKDDHYRDVLDIIAETKMVPYEWRFSFIRRQIENFYGEPISADLIKLDDRGRYRKKIAAFETVSRPGIIGSMRSTIEDEWTDSWSSATDDKRKLVACADLLEKTPLMENGRFRTDRVVRMDQLDLFCDAVEGSKRDMETLFDHAVRKDFRASPIQTLNRILAHLGLKLVRTKKSRKNSKSIYEYELEKQSTERLLKIVERRKTMKGGRSCLDDINSNHLPPLDEPPLFDAAE